MPRQLDWWVHWVTDVYRIVRALPVLGFPVRPL